MSRYDNREIVPDAPAPRHAMPPGAGHPLLTMLVAAAALPLLWLIGVLTLMAIVGVATAMLVWARARRRWLSRQVDVVDVVGPN